MEAGLKPWLPEKHKRRGDHEVTPHYDRRVRGRESLSKRKTMNELKAQYSKLSDNELLIIVYIESSDYAEEEIKNAKSILDERG